MQGLTRFLGDSPLKVLLKLVVVSFLVGLVMSAFGWTPLDIVYGIQALFERIWNMGFATLDRFLSYMLLGAAIVVPLFLIIRITRFRS
ncbi:DUF6460 domain-containing protein [Arvimicrobium flavum]|uniref:DUF6460 domain-containing protein n=1 Tax=Arvimicrobium flavum TaxID=3393320 RepID=UPI00237BF3B3|nr:DUF6460 domain-containing protein [Mesorhizobium shangrilense]